MFKIKFITLLSLLCVSASQTSSAQTVQDAVIAAIKNHPQIEQAHARLGVADEEIKAVRSEMLPELSVGLTGGRMFGDNSTSRGTLTTRGSTYSGLGEGNASLQQPIFKGFQTLNRFRASKNDQQSAKLLLQDTQERIAYATAQSYANIMQAREAIALINQHKDIMQKAHDEIEMLVDEGAASDAELQQAQNILNAADTILTDFTEQLRVEEARYIELTGFPPFQDMREPKFENKAYETWLPESIGAAISYIDMQHPAILSAKEDTAAVLHEIEAEKGFLYPELLGELSYLKSDKREEIGGEVEDARAVLRMNWAFETGGGQFARIKQRKHEYREARAREEEVRRQVERDVRLAFIDRDIAARRIDEQDRVIALAQDLLETYDIQFEGGLVSLLQLMQAEDQLFIASLDNNNFYYQKLVAELGVFASLGRLQDVLFYDDTEAFEVIQKQSITKAAQKTNMSEASLNFSKPIAEYDPEYRKIEMPQGGTTDGQ